MKKLLIASTAALAFISASAQAQDFFNGTGDSRWSVSVLGGGSAHPDTRIGAVRVPLGDGFNAGARLSYNLNDVVGMPGFAVDADYFYNQSDFTGNGAQLGSHSFMADLTYHAPLGDKWSAYGGAGLGAVETNLYGSLHGSSTVFGWQALGGLEYRFTPTTALFAEYRYQNAHNANLGVNGPVGNTSNNLSMGVKYTF